MKSFVFITGATGGLGKALAVECATRGWNLFITDISAEALESLSTGLTNTYGIEVITFPCDLTNTDSRQELFSYIQKAGVCFRMLINVAGLDYQGVFYKRTPEEIRTILRVNIEANLETTYAVMRLRDKSTVFRIINVSSLAAFYPMPVKAIYAASKRFLLNFSIALREELRHSGATVTILCPAGMPTTEGCIRGIEAQGFFGRITAKDPGYVAARTIDRALKGSTIYVPGVLNWLLMKVGGVVPMTLAAKVVGNRWES